MTRALARSHHDAYDETRAWIKELIEFLRVRFRAGRGALAGAALTHQHADGSAPRWREDPGRLLRLSGTEALYSALRLLALTASRVQLLALALGGSVGRNPSGRFFIGPERLELTRALAQRRDFALARVRRRAALPRMPPLCAA